MLLIRLKPWIWGHSEAIDFSTLVLAIVYQFMVAAYGVQGLSGGRNGVEICSMRAGSF